MICQMPTPRVELWYGQTCYRGEGYEADKSIFLIFKMKISLTLVLPL